MIINAENMLNMDNIKLDSARGFSFELGLPEFDEVMKDLQEIKNLGISADQIDLQAGLQSNQKEIRMNLLKTLQELAMKDQIPVRMENLDDIRLFINSRELYGINENRSIKLDSMTKDDIDFFKLCLEKKELTIDNINSKDATINIMNIDNANQVSYKSLNFSKGLFNLIEYSFQKQKPVRLDFQGDSSVILKVNKEGKLTAEFISNEKAMEYVLRSSIPNLKNKFDSEGIPYEKIFYREQSKKNKKGDKK